MTLVHKSPFLTLWALLVFKNQDLLRLGCRRTVDTVYPLCIKEKENKKPTTFIWI